MGANHEDAVVADLVYDALLRGGPSTAVEIMAAVGLDGLGKQQVHRVLYQRSMDLFDRDEETGQWHLRRAPAETQLAALRDEGPGRRPGDLAERATRVFQFLIELQRLRTRVVRTTDTYRGVQWFSDVPNAPEVSTPASGLVDAWLVIDRAERLPPPPVPEDLSPWITQSALRDSRRDAPTLSERALRSIDVVLPDGDHSTETEELFLDDHPQVETALNDWLPEWQAWAVVDRHHAAVAEVYQRLYTMYQESRASAENYELVLAFGYLTTESGGQEVRRHLITVRAVIELDLNTGRLSVLPAPDDPVPVLEQDMLDPSDTVSDEVRESVQTMLGELGDLWEPDPAGISTPLRAWVNGVRADAMFLPQTVPHAASGQRPIVSLAPALILRERNRRSFIAACDQVLRALAAGVPVPTGLEQFLEITDGRVGEGERVRWAAQFDDGEIYFPKESNEDQRRIVERLANDRTIVVQGPPGTGKTHTIANLVTDLLAHGQRVLITSTTTRALKVLKGQLPEEIRDLCVSVTDDAIRGQADLERSVNTILTQADTWNAPVADCEAERLRAGLARARAKAARALQELQTIREQETFEYAPEIGDYQGTLQQIAARLAAGQDQLGWLGHVPADRPTIPSSEVQLYRLLLRRATHEVRESSGDVPRLDLLPPVADVETLLRRRTELEEQRRELEAAADVELVRALRAHAVSRRQTILQAGSEFLRLAGELDHRPEPWVGRAVRDVLAGREHTWLSREEQTQETLELAASASEQIGTGQVTGLDRLDPADALAQCVALLEHLGSGKKLKGVLGRAKVAKESSEFLEAVRVDGRACESTELLAIARARIEMELALRAAEQVWDRDDTAAPPRHRLAALKDDSAILHTVLALATARAAVQRETQGVHGLVLGPVEPASVRALVAALDQLQVDDLRRDTEEKIAPALIELRRVAGSAKAVAAVTGLVDALERWDVSKYGAALQQLRVSVEANALLAELGEVQAKVAAALPELAAAITAAPDDPVWDRRLHELDQAWAWSVWDARVRSKTDPDAERRWRTELANAETEERALLKELAANRGWANALRRLTPYESTHLNMYSLAVRKAGKGTGKHARKHQENARASLRECQTAVPAWIMPMHVVFETVPTDRPNTFDVVIIDEASQSGLEGLLLSWLAPRLVVVGDDKQVSPSNVGLQHDEVYTLQDRYLTGLETRSLYGPMNSFFDQAVGMARSRIMLREHFRCMPEIIGFSNELSYQGKLVPLRQYGANRLPPLRTTYIQGALVAGRRDVVNEAEAQALVDQVAKCCADPAYDGKSMGVITLLGNSQDKLIMSRLIDTLGVKEVEQRHLRAGNAEAFQGDERDVIFMSLVSSLNSVSGPVRIGVLNKEADQQRLNVAASRARDQVWLFHSVHPGELSDKDLRRRYLQYVLKPPREQDGLDIGDVSPHERHPAFDSLFEQRVFLAIRNRGYRVRPQVQVGHYRIDLVIEGGTKRLAVECDGDAFHGSETYADDVARQRDLERAKWTFWRVRGSAFFRDPEQAMEPLWDLLDRLGIEPVAWESEPPEDEVAQQVMATATPVASTTTDLSDVQIDSATSLESAGPVPAPLGHRSPPDQAPAVVMPQSGRRFRNGKMLLTPSAHLRVQEEVAAIRAWLANPPQPVIVDSRSADDQRQRLERHRTELGERLDYLSRVLRQSILDEEHVGGEWVTPGCLLGLRFGGDTQPVERYVVAVLEVKVNGVETISPFTELGQAIDGAAAGATVQYESPRGLKTVVIAEILD